MRHALLVTSVLIGLAACSNDTPPADPAPAVAPAAKTEGATSHAFSPEITAADYAEFTRVLASDELEGRGPGSPGETKTIEYLIQHYQRMGFEPGNNGSWIQTVPMVTTTTQQGASLTLNVAGQPHALEFGTQMVLGTRNGAPETVLKDSEVVFVGYGVNAPELGWNDYADLDVKGKTVVMFINDPGFHTGDESLFEGRRMTYYGRWTYKYEEAARQGAAAALIIHDDAGAAYPWAVVQNGWSGPQFDLPASEDPEPRLPMQGWLTAESAQLLIASTGKDLETLRREASTAGFKPFAMQASLSANFKSTVREGKSDNVVALLPGSARPDEAVIYMAHWDHLGRTFQATGDGIFNGAIDNATGRRWYLGIGREVCQRPSATTQPAVSHRDIGRVRLARLQVLRRASNRAAKQDRWRHQSRCDDRAGSHQGFRGGWQGQLGTRRPSDTAAGKRRDAVPSPKSRFRTAITSAVIISTSPKRVSPRSTQRADSITSKKARNMARRKPVATPPRTITSHPTSLMRAGTCRAWWKTLWCCTASATH
jgi:hypothetical protein